MEVTRNEDNISNMAKTIKNKQKNQNRPSLITQDIIIRQPQRTTSDVSRWRSALISADAGRPKMLFDLYEDLLIDGVLGDAVDKRIKAVLNSELIYQGKDGKMVEPVMELLDTLEWEELITEIMHSLFYGRSGVEFDFRTGFHISTIPPKHISLETKSILINDTDAQGIPYDGDKNLLVIGKKRNWGLFLKTAPFAIWKRGGFGDYAQWLEIFGMPQRIGKYSSYDPQSRLLLEEALQKAGSAPWCVIPKESEVETVNNTGSGSSGTSYNDFRKACNEELLITVQGQTLTTIQGDKGARSLGDVHKDVAESLNKADMRFVEKVLNTYVRPILEWQGFPVQGGKFTFPDIAESLTVQDIVLLSDILPIPRSYIYNKYGIPVPEENEEVAGKGYTALKEPEKELEPVKPVKEPKEVNNEDIRQNLTFFDRCLSFFVSAPTWRSGANRNFITRLTDSITGTITLADDYSIDIDALVEEALKEIYAEEGNPIVNRNLFNITNNTLQHAIDTTLSNADTDYTRRFKDNAAVFAAFKNHQQTEEIAALIRDENGKIKPFYKFKKEALQISQNYNINWLQTEYNTAVQSARTAQNMMKFQETAHLYPNLEYIRSAAAHPRASHLRYAGTILPISHPWWTDHLPPSDWNCQCSVRQTDKDVTAVPDGSGDDDPVFTHDLMSDAEFVKIEKTAYYKATDKTLREEIRKTAVEFLRIAEEKQIEVYKGKKGGYLEIVRQNGIERKKNLDTYKIMADQGGRYTLLSEQKIQGVKNPDAFNFIKGVFSDAKHPVSASGKAAIQNSIKKAAEQGVEEVVIRLESEYKITDIYEGLKAALQGNRAKVIKEIILIRKNRNPLYLDVERLRKRFRQK